MILCLGEVVWDQVWVLDQFPQLREDRFIVEERETPGGCALNTAVTLSFLGSQVALVGNPLGEDVHGRTILEYLKQHGVEAHLTQIKNLKTPTCHVLLEKKTGDRGFMSSKPTMSYFSRETLVQAEKDSLSGRYHSVFVQPTLQRFGEDYLRAVQANRDVLLITQDVSADSAYAELSNVVQISRDDRIPWTVEAIEDEARPYFHGRCTRVLITLGSKGAAICEKGKSPVLRPAHRVMEVVDTTGCGDVFRSGLMNALENGEDWLSALEKGQAVAAKKASISGSHLAKFPYRNGSF